MCHFLSFQPNRNPLILISSCPLRDIRGPLVMTAPHIFMSMAEPSVTLKGRVKGTDVCMRVRVSSSLSATSVSDGCLVSNHHLSSFIYLGLGRPNLCFPLSPYNYLTPPPPSPPDPPPGLCYIYLFLMSDKKLFVLRYDSYCMLGGACEK